jgi:hypothetical protein
LSGQEVRGVYATRRGGVDVVERVTKAQEVQSEQASSRKHTAHSAAFDDKGDFPAGWCRARRPCGSTFLQHA